MTCLKPHSYSWMLNRIDTTIMVPMTVAVNIACCLSPSSSAKKNAVKHEGVSSGQLVYHVQPHALSWKFRTDPREGEQWRRWGRVTVRTLITDMPIPFTALGTKEQRAFSEDRSLRYTSRVESSGQGGGNFIFLCTVSGSGVRLNLFLFFLLMYLVDHGNSQY